MNERIVVHIRDRNRWAVYEDISWLGEFSDEELAKQFAAVPDLVEAAECVLRNMIDSESYGPDPANVDDDNNWPCDEDGDLWYPDIWDLAQALNRMQG